jgi:prepilin-type N-terminal cleavage/methylation domain-containing protein
MVTRAQAGFTLVELSVVLVVTSLLMVAYLDASRLWLENRRRDVTMEHISLIHDALTHYYARNGAYPCPAAPVSSPDDTKIDCTALDAMAMQQAQQHGIAFIHSKAGRKIIEGAVPYKQLSIPRESTLDGWGSQFTYAVTAGLTSHDTFNANDGGIDIVDENEKSLIEPSASALWALASHGSDGSGSYDGAATPQSCPSGRRDTLNCSHQGRFMVAPAGRADNREHYDDIVFYRAWVDYLPGAAESYCQIALPRRQQDKTPSQVQDGVMIQVCGEDAQALNPNGPACQFLICRGGRLVPGVIDLTATGGKS